jgi:tetratricopeptide (TPR) repeat protein
VGGKQRVEGLEAPLIGRDRELRRITSAFHAAAELRSPHHVVVSGEAGVGKSRLGWEFEKYVDGLADPVFWHRGRCLSYGQGTVFWALAEMVRQRLGVAEDDPPEVVRARLDEGMAQLVTTLEDRSYIRPRLGRLLGVVDSTTDVAVLGREELFAGWRMFFEHLAATRPVVLLVEDAQHADPALLEFLDHLVEWAKDAPIYVLVLVRTEVAGDPPAPGAHQARVEVARLDVHEMGQLVCALLPGIDGGSELAIAEQARGNPLFGVEIVRSLIDGGVVTPVAGTYRLTGDVGALAVPDNLQALFASRLDSLEASARELVGVAAVLGTTFSAEALAAVSGRSLPLVEQGLAGLVSRSVLEVSTDPLSPERGSYEFGQHMLRQVALETLSRRDRKARHLGVAAHLRKAFSNDGEEVIGVVAQHYLDALAAVPEDPDCAEIRSLATAAMTRAAHLADRSGAPAQAARLHTDAATLMLQGTTDRTLEAAAAWEQAAAAYDRAGSLEQTLELGRRATAVYQAQGLERAAARSSARVARAAGLRGRHQEAHSALSAAFEVLRVDPDEDTVFALSELATLEMFGGMPGWRDRVEAALGLAQELGVPKGQLAKLFMVRGIAFTRVNSADDAVAAYEEAASLAEQAGDSRMLALCLTNLARVLLPALAVVADARACDLARRMGASGLLGGCVENLAWTLIYLGDWDEAERVLAAALSVDGLETEDEVHSTVAFLAALRGDTATWEAHADLPVMRGSEDPQARVSALVADAFLAAALGQHTDVVAISGRILSEVSTLGMMLDLIYWTWPLAARSALLLGDLDRVRELVTVLDSHPVEHLPPLLVAEGALARASLLAAESDDRAEQALASAVRDLREAGSPFHLAQALVDCAEQLRLRGKDQDALAMADEAREIASRLGARPLLQQVAQLMS